MNWKARNKAKNEVLWVEMGVDEAYAENVRK